MAVLLDGEKHFEDTITRIERIHEGDRQPDGQTPHDGIGRRGLCRRCLRAMAVRFNGVDNARFLQDGRV